MLLPSIRKLLLISAVMLGCGAVTAYVTDHDIVRLTLQILAANAFGFWIGLQLSTKARTIDDFQSLIAALDWFYLDPEQSDHNKKLVAAYAVDSLSAHADRLETSNPIKES